MMYYQKHELARIWQDKTQLNCIGATKQLYKITFITHMYGLLYNDFDR